MPILMIFQQILVYPGLEVSVITLMGELMTAMLSERTLEILWSIAKGIVLSWWGDIFANCYIETEKEKYYANIMLPNLCWT